MNDEQRKLLKEELQILRKLKRYYFDNRERLECPQPFYTELVYREVKVGMELEASTQVGRGIK